MSPGRSRGSFVGWFLWTSVQLPELESFEPASLNLPLTWSLRNTTAAITASAIRATRRMYSTIEAPRSSLANFASNQVRNTNRFMELDPLCFCTRPRTGPRTVVSVGASNDTERENLEH